MRLSELRGEPVLDAVANMVGPIAAIAEDSECMELFKSGGEGEGRELAMSRIGNALPVLLRKHKKDVVAILAAANLQDPEAYEKSLSLPKLLKDAYDVMTDEELLSFFESPETVDAS